MESLLVYEISFLLWVMVIDVFQIVYVDGEMWIRHKDTKTPTRGNVETSKNYTEVIKCKNLMIWSYKIHQICENKGKTTMHELSNNLNIRNVAEIVSQHFRNTWERRKQSQNYFLKLIGILF